MFLVAEAVNARKYADGQPGEHTNAAKIGDGSFVGFYQIVRSVNDSKLQCDLLTQRGGEQSRDE
ncbi:hypothetical protein ES703_71961 [subsurface metagenome]